MGKEQPRTQALTVYYAAACGVRGRCGMQSLPSAFRPACFPARPSRVGVVDHKRLCTRLVRGKNHSLISFTHSLSKMSSQYIFGIAYRLTDDILNCCLWLRFKKIFQTSNGVALLWAFVVQSNIIIIDLLNKLKYLSIVMDHRVISLGK